MYLNLLLRNYLTPSGRELSLVDQAEKLRNKTGCKLPDSASNNQCVSLATTHPPRYAHPACARAHAHTHIHAYIYIRSIYTYVHK